MEGVSPGFVWRVVFDVVGFFNFMSSLLVGSCGAVLLCRQHHGFLQFSAHRTAVSFESVHPPVPDLFKCQLIF